MSQELVYTSSPQGLKIGTRGFCTVASTSGMVSTLAERLESLSGYRHLAPPGDPRAALNPVVYSHVMLPVGGVRWHVLSRIADAGLDYSQRSNKLAHHVVLDERELPAGGPAWCMMQPGFFLTQWREPARLLPPRALPVGDVPPAECRAWKQLAGDAGWGGVLAESAQLSGGAFLLFRPGMETLPLLAESLALLSPKQRWETTFSTFFTRLPPGVECAWRCVDADSEEAVAVRRQRGALVLDLTAPPGPPPEGVWTDAARSGRFVEQPRAPDLAVPVFSSPLTGLDTTPDADLTGGEYELSQLDISRPLRSPPPVSLPAKREERSRSHRWIAGIIAATLLVTVVSASVTIYVLRDRIFGSTEIVASVEHEENAEPPVESTPPRPASDAERKKDTPVEKTPAVKQPSPPKPPIAGSQNPPAQENQIGDDVTPPNSKPSTGKTETPLNAAAVPATPPRKALILWKITRPTDTSPQLRAVLPISPDFPHDAQNTHLEFKGCEGFFIKPNGIAKWEIARANKGSSATEPLKPAVITIEPDGYAFSWNPQGAQFADSLYSAWLEIRSKDGSKPRVQISFEEGVVVRGPLTFAKVDGERKWRLEVPKSEPMEAPKSEPKIHISQAHELTAEGVVQFLNEKYAASLRPEVDRSGRLPVLLGAISIGDNKSDLPKPRFRIRVSISLSGGNWNVTARIETLVRSLKRERPWNIDLEKDKYVSISERRKEQLVPDLTAALRERNEVQGLIDGKRQLELMNLEMDKEKNSEKITKVKKEIADLEELKEEIYPGEFLKADTTVANNEVKINRDALDQLHADLHNLKINLTIVRVRKGDNDAPRVPVAVFGRPSGSEPQK